jgi:hypothetical protein
MKVSGFGKEAVAWNVKSFGSAGESAPRTLDNGLGGFNNHVRGSTRLEVYKIS